MAINFRSYFQINNLRFFLFSLFIFLGVTPLIGLEFKFFVYFLLVIWMLSILPRVLFFDLYCFILLFIPFIFISIIIDLYYYDYKLINYYNFFFYFNLFFGLVLSQFFSKSDLILFIEKFTMFFVYLGFPFHLLFVFFPSLIEYCFSYDNGHGVHKTLGFINFHISDIGLYEGRFMSFAWEPGIMQMFLNIALYSRITRIKKIDLQILFLILVIFWTYSTAGYFILFFILLFKGYIFRPVFLFLLTFFLFFFWDFILEIYSFQVDYKLINSTSFSGRYDRLFDILNKWDIDDLFFGKGSNFYDLYLKDQDLGGFDSITNLIQRYGFLSVFLLFSLLIINNMNNLGIIFILFATFFSQPIWFAPFVASFYFEGDRFKKIK